MRVLACVKRVPAPGARIVLTPDQRGIDAEYLAFTTSPHEECATEEAVRLVETHGGASTVLTVGPEDAEEQLRTAVGIGVGSAVLVPTDGSDWDAIRTAAAIVEAIGVLESAGGVFDLILFGNESADSGGHQVGVRVAHALGRPMVSGAKGLDIADGTVTVRRDAAAGYEVYRLPLPAAVGVREGLNLPRYPTLKGRLASKKASIERVEADPGPGPQRMVRLVEPPERVSETVMLGEGVAAASPVVDVLDELGVL